MQNNDMLNEFYKTYIFIKVIINEQHFCIFKDNTYISLRA
jgi:hypothetical protein